MYGYVHKYFDSRYENEMNITFNAFEIKGNTMEVYLYKINLSNN